MTLPSQLVIGKHVSPLLYRLGGAGPWQIHIQEPKRPRDKRFFACHVCHLRLVLGQEKGAATGDQPFVQAACACFLSTACGENTCTLLLLHKHMSVVLDSWTYIDLCPWNCLYVPLVMSCYSAKIQHLHVNV